MRLAVKEIGAGNMAAGAGGAAQPRKGAVEDGRAAPGRIGCGGGQLPVACQHRVRQEIEFGHVGDNGIKHEWCRLVPGEFIDDHVAGKVAQAGKAPVTAIGPGKAQPAQGRDVDGIIAPVVEHRVEERAVNIHRAGLVAGAGDEEPLVDVGPVVTGGAGDSEFPRRAAENLGAVKQHVAIGDQRQIGLVDALFLEVQHQFRQRILIEDIRTGGQRVGDVNIGAATGNGFRDGAQPGARCEAVDKIIGAKIVRDDRACRFHRIAVGRDSACAKHSG